MLAAARRHIGGGGVLGGLRKGLSAVHSRAIPLVLNLRGHLRLARALASPELAGLRQRHPRIEYKYLSRYLASHLSTSARLAILTHHLERMRARAIPGFLGDIFDEGSMLWEETRDDHRFGIALSYPHSFFLEGVELDAEGDLSLVFHVDGAPASFLSFTLAPGRMVGAPDDEVLFVGIVQGVWGRGDAIKAAEHTLRYTPALLLLVAAQAIALSLGATAVVGVSARAQLSSAEAGFRFAYDELWRSCGAESLDGWTYRLPVPFPEKPIETIKRDHRPRVRRKRAFKHSVAEHVRFQFASRFLRPELHCHPERSEGSRS